MEDRASGHSFGPVVVYPRRSIHAGSGSWAGRGGFVDLSILPVVGDAPGTDPLGTISTDVFDLPISNPLLFAFDVAALGLSFVVGDPIAISLGTRSAIPGIKWATSFEMTSGAGGLFIRSVNPLQSWEPFPLDSVFRTDVEPIPEPSSGILLGLGIYLVASLRNSVQLQSIRATFAGPGFPVSR